MTTFSELGIGINGAGYGETSTTCPQCSHNRKKKNDKCLSVNVSEEIYYCHHCGWGGSLRSGDVSKTPYASSPKNDKPGKTIKKPTFSYSPDLPEHVYDFLVHKRCIREDVIERNKICFKNGAIQFPFYKNGEVVNIKSRTLDKKFWQSGGSEKVVYGYDDIEDDCLIWVEGELDKLAVEVAGIRSCVSVPEGASPKNTKNYTGKFEFLENCKDRLEKVEMHIIAVDNDGPGMTLQKELTRRLGVEKCKIVSWPEGCKDADDVLVQDGPDALKRCIDEAKPCPIKGVFTVSDAYERTLHLYDNDFAGGEKMGLAGLDELYSVKPGEWTLVTGIPSHGKSELIDAMIIALAENCDWKFGVCSPENQPLERHISKLLEKRVGKPFREGPAQRMSSQELKEESDWLNSHIFFILPDEDNLTIDEVLSLAKKLVFREGIKGLVIDPWNELDHSRSLGMSETEYISQVLTKIRLFARANEVHVWVVAHPTKLQKGTDGSYPVPTPYDVAGSAHWRNKADNCLSIWRDVTKPEDRQVQVHVQKIRFKEVGKIGMALLTYDCVTGTYSDDCPF